MALRSIHDVPAPAKLNLFLHVTGKRPDGYHLLDSTMVPIDWCDTLHVERRDDGRLQRHDLGAGPASGLPGDDLVVRAARALQQASGTRLGADLYLDKRIPMGAGLGGGSSDAASTLLALNRLWGLDWPLERLLPIGLALGADVPFFLGGTPARVGGIGEELVPIEHAPAVYAVVKPPGSCETRAVFTSPRLAERLAARAAPARIAGFSERNGLDAERNDLEVAAVEICPGVEEAIAWCERAFGNGRMTGSGSAVFARVDEARGDPALPDLPEGWQGRTCRSLARHPLFGWARREAG